MTQPNKPHTVHIETFGCQMNEYDSELVRSLLRKAGFEFTEDRERADRDAREHEAARKGDEP